MSILITGANGFLGTYLVAALLEKNIPVIATGKGPNRLPVTVHPQFQYIEMDFTDAAAVAKVLATYTPQVIVHTGAMSKPDECELNKEAAWLVNVTGTENLLNHAGGAHFIFLSTDFIFDGIRGMYSEEDAPNPINYYGHTKLQAEAAVKAYAGPWAIVRTVLAYGKPLSNRGNFLSLIQGKLERGEAYKVVSDQLRTPTYIGDLAAGIVTIIENRKTGTWHLSGEDVLTPYDMACQLADYLSLDKSVLTPVTADTFIEPAKRPLRTGFTIAKAKRELGYQPVSFREGVRRSV